MTESTPSGVHAYADQLRQYATHFAPRDWDYTRDTRIEAIRHTDDRDRRLTDRLRLAVGALLRDHGLPGIKVPRWRMARHYLRRDPNLPDGVLDGGNVITFWEETGEYLQYVQPSVGALLADLMDAHPDLPEVRAIADEMKRINDRYGARLAATEDAA